MTFPKIYLEKLWHQLNVLIVTGTSGITKKRAGGNQRKKGCSYYISIEMKFCLELKYSH